MASSLSARQGLGPAYLPLDSSLQTPLCPAGTGDMVQLTPSQKLGRFRLDSEQAGPLQILATGCATRPAH